MLLGLIQLCPRLKDTHYLKRFLREIASLVPDSRTQVWRKWENGLFFGVNESYSIWNSSLSQRLRFLEEKTQQFILSKVPQNINNTFLKRTLDGNHQDSHQFGGLTARQLFSASFEATIFLTTHRFGAALILEDIKKEMAQMSFFTHSDLHCARTQS